MCVKCVVWLPGASVVRGGSGRHDCWICCRGTRSGKVRSRRRCRLQLRQVLKCSRSGGSHLLVGQGIAAVGEMGQEEGEVHTFGLLRSRAVWTAELPRTYAVYIRP